MPESQRKKMRPSPRNATKAAAQYDWACRFEKVAKFRAFLSPDPA
jgi:hypothetical protein